MLNKIRIMNFKSLRDVTIEFAPRFTVFIGENGSGKSSVLQFLAMLKQSYNHARLIPKGNEINLGGLDELDELKFNNNPISFELYGSFYIHEIFNDEKLQPILLGYYIILDQEFNIKRFDILIDSERVDLSKDTGKEFHKDNILIVIRRLSTLNIRDRIIRIEFQEGSSGATISRGKAYSVLESLQGEFNKLYFIWVPRGITTPTQALENNPVYYISSAIYNKDGQLVSTFAYNEELEERIASLIEKITGRYIKHKLIPGQKVRLDAILSEGKKVNIINEGFGTNQLVYLLFNLVVSPKGSTICIEDPEAHLHPKAQIRLVDLLEDISSKERKRVVLTTHSELVVLHLLNLVAEGKMKNDELAIYYFWKEGVETKVRRLEIAEDGSTEMIPGFTDVILEEHKRYIEAKFKDKK